jgi:hypothetical protein
MTVTSLASVEVFPLKALEFLLLESTADLRGRHIRVVDFLSLLLF